MKTARNETKREYNDIPFEPYLEMLLGLAPRPTEAPRFSSNVIEGPSLQAVTAAAVASRRTAPVRRLVQPYRADRFKNGLTLVLSAATAFLAVYCVLELLPILRMISAADRI